jgi:hypothetical protein
LLSMLYWSSHNRTTDCETNPYVGGPAVKMIYVLAKKMFMQQR